MVSEIIGGGGGLYPPQPPPPPASYAYVDLILFRANTKRRGRKSGLAMQEACFWYFSRERKKTDEKNGKEKNYFFVTEN